MSKNKSLKVIELFAGVGGFRLGLEAVKPNGSYAVMWSNQWEPSTIKQHASLVYKSAWPNSNHSNENIFDVLSNASKLNSLRKLDADVLVGGFPCQDYSVARPLNQASGIAGKKGVLWWAIHKILKQRVDDKKPIKYLILENVDRLLKSPASCRGRDFAVMLSSLLSLGYAVEWRVVNAADYGFPQRRKRIFIVGYYKGTNIYKKFSQRVFENRAENYLFRESVLARSLPIQDSKSQIAPEEILLDPYSVSKDYMAHANSKSRFYNSGIAIDRKYWTHDSTPKLIDNFTSFTGSRSALTLGDVVKKTKHIPQSFFINKASLEKWRYLKGAKSILRVKENGIEYTYDEGSMSFPDDMKKPSRTIITGEGGASPSRFKHVIKVGDKYRRLLPEELEELNGFPRGFTKHVEVSDGRRSFFMGNALIVGLVRVISEKLYEMHEG